jgi:hypothetical protein
MRGIWRKIGQTTLALLVAAGLGVADTSNTMPPPGTLNYVEGQVSVQGHIQSPKSVGSTYLAPNQVIDTGRGHAEMLLTPGVYMRLGNNSEVRMISPGLADTQVQVTRGSAMVEVDELFKENDVSVVTDGATTQLEKQGLYEFNANHPSVEVLDGKAITREGDAQVRLTKGHEALLAESQPPVKQKYNKDQIENDPLYRWSKLRSEYATEANVDSADMLMAEGGWWGPGWYWDPFWADFAFMPGMGMFWGPFGFPFFSPWTVGWAPYYGFRGGFGSPYRYAAAGGTIANGKLPPLAHKLSPGSAGFHALPRSAAGGRMAMGGFRGGSRGGFGGRSMASAHAGGFGGGFHGGFGGRR